MKQTRRNLLVAENIWKKNSAKLIEAFDSSSFHMCFISSMKSSRWIEEICITTEIEKRSSSEEELRSKILHLFLRTLKNTFSSAIRTAHILICLIFNRSSTRHSANGKRLEDKPSEISGRLSHCYKALHIMHSMNSSWENLSKDILLKQLSKRFVTTPHSHCV